MSLSRTFQISLLVSLFIHGAIIFQGLNLPLLPNKSKQERIEIRYIRAKQEVKGKPSGNAGTKNEPLFKIAGRITADKRTPPPFIEKKETLGADKQRILPGPGFNKPALLKPSTLSLNKKITLPPIDTEKINNPSYISYYQIVREKIKRAAYQNYTHNETGEVYLSFIISSDGYLKETRLIAEKSSASAYLKETSLSSLKEASPFPSFPKELDYPYLTFNLIISFEVE